MLAVHHYIVYSTPAFAAFCAVAVSACLFPPTTGLEISGSRPKGPLRALAFLSCEPTLCPSFESFRCWRARGDGDGGGVCVLRKINNQIQVVPHAWAFISEQLKSYSSALYREKTTTARRRNLFPTVVFFPPSLTSQHPLWLLAPCPVPLVFHQE